MKFWPFKPVSLGSVIQVWEGVLALAQDPSSHDVAGDLFLLVTALQFLTPDGPPGFLVTSLPVLYHLADKYGPAEYAKQTIPLLAGASTVASLSTTTWGMLDNWTEVIAGQSLMSTAIACTIAGIIQVHRLADSTGAFSGVLERATGFGVIWATGWQLWGRTTPFGQYGTPMLSPDCLKLLQRLHRHTGQAGADMAGGAIGYLVYRAFNQRPSSSSDRDDSDRFEELPVNLEEPILPTWRGERRQAEPRQPIGKKAFALASGMLVVNTIAGSPVATSLSAPLDEATPLSVGCVLPARRRKGFTDQADAIVHAAETIGASAKLLVTPESAVTVRSRLERALVIEELTDRVCAKYKVWVVLGLDSYSWTSDGASLHFNSTYRPSHLPTPRQAKRRNEVVLIGPAGEIGHYVKQRLITFVESYPMERGTAPVPVWQIPLTPPPRVNKTDWAPSFPFVREIPISPLICLDAFHPSLLPSGSVFRGYNIIPLLVTVSAAAPNDQTSERIFSQAQRLSVQHGIPSLVCSSTRQYDRTAALSGLIDATGEAVHRQRGGESFVAKLSIPYDKAGRGRSRTGAEAMGSSGAIGATALVLAARRLLGQRSAGPVVEHQEEEDVSGSSAAGPRTPRLYQNGWFRMRPLLPSSVSTLWRRSRGTDSMKSTGVVEDPFLSTRIRSGKLVSLKSASAGSYGSVDSSPSIPHHRETESDEPSRKTFVRNPISPLDRQTTNKPSPLISLCSTSDV